MCWQRYKGYQQHDAHELLWTVLDILRVEERKRLRELEAAQAAAAASSTAASEQHRNNIPASAIGEGKEVEAEAVAPKRKKPPKTYVDHIFGGQYRR
jgi:hypothetical protein